MSDFVANPDATALSSVRLSEKIDAATLLTLSKEQLRAVRGTIFQAPSRFESVYAVDKRIQKWTRWTDQLLITLWQQHAALSSLALVAVGGFGREDLFPASDIDLLMLVKQPPDDNQERHIGDFLQRLWDLGLSPSHSVRTVPQCIEDGQRDITVQTNLLEHRYLTGNPTLYAYLHDRVRAQLIPQTFFRDKMAEMHSRHHKFDNSPYQLEPNCKEGPGGLRDIHILLWVAQAAGFGRRWSELALRDLMTIEEADQIEKKASFLRIVRMTLHQLTGRNEDRLRYDLQPQVAQALGFTAQQGRQASEVLMQHYFWATKAVVQIGQIVLQNLEAVLFPSERATQQLNERFVRYGDQIDLAHDQVFSDSPSAMLEIFLLMANHPEITGMTVRTQRALLQQRFAIDASFTREPAHRELFLAIIKAPQGITHALRRMNQTSILGRYLPEFRAIVGQMQHDAFHVYTVDQHILLVVRNVRRFGLDRHAHEFPLCSSIMAKLDKPWLLYIAALYHDIAKGRGGDHSLLGMKDVQRFCRRHQLAKEDSDLVAFLVQHHLTLSQVAQKQDIEDPATIAAFAAIVQTRNRLNFLYLLTVADIRATSPKVWNSWRAHLLETLYHSTYRYLQTISPLMLGQVAPPSEDDPLQQKREHALAQFASDLLPVIHSFWQQLDLSYFLRYSVDEIVWHTHGWLRFKESGGVQIAMTDKGWRVGVFSADGHHLFARICRALEQHNWSVLSARIETTTQGYSLDTFWLQPQVAQLETSWAQAQKNALEQQAWQSITQISELPQPVLGSLPRRARTFPVHTQVELQFDSKDENLMINVVTNDRRGLLYALAYTFAQYGLDLRSARITTLGERVEDSFLVRGLQLNGALLKDSIPIRQLEADLLQRLNQQ